MKKLMLILIISMMFSMVSYAGQWQQDEVGWRYMEDDGTYKTGWYQDVNSKWYYLDQNTNYMLANTVIPDGYYVSESGEWVETKPEVKYGGYDNKVELESSAYSFPGGPRLIGYALPTTVYFNNKYENIYTGEINVSRVEISKDGIPCIEFSGSDRDIYELMVKRRYNFEDGSSVDDVDYIFAHINSSGEKSFNALLKPPSKLEARPKWTSVEIYIDKSTLDR